MTRPWLVMLLIGAVLVCESATLSGARKEVEQHCENQCQQKSLRIRQVTTDNNCKDKCFSKMMIMIHEANWDWKDVACSWCYGLPSDEVVSSCIANCRRHLPGTLTPQEANWDWKDVACSSCSILLSPELVESCIADCRGWLPGLNQVQC